MIIHFILQKILFIFLDILSNFNSNFKAQLKQLQGNHLYIENK